jgi:hypothetical protein
VTPGPLTFTLLALRLPAWRRRCRTNHRLPALWRPRHL